jgi:chromosome segregation ATPase
MDFMQKEVREKDELIRKLKFDQQTQGDENRTLREENSLYRGRCANLQRDIEMQGGAMSKLGSDAGTLGEQVELYKNRVSQLEEELARVSEERTDYIFDVKRLTTEKGKLEEELHKVQTESVRAQGDSQASGATLSRL